MEPRADVDPEAGARARHADGADSGDGLVEVDPVDDDVIALVEPRDGVPGVVASPAALTRCAAAVAAGTGPVAVDAERASGYRYGQRAYLVQVRRAGAGTWLVDPIACPDLTVLTDAVADAEWVLHAAHQDLPCLAEVGLVPRAGLFDTELAGRLLNRPRVGLAHLVEAELGLRLAKEHSAVDWSTRPLPEPWLRYAALDVEVLIELRDLLHAHLEASGKLAWALQEFAAEVTAPPSPPRVDPWRRTSGLHRVRTRRGLAVVRSLWVARDDLARRRDTAPGRVLVDAALVEAGTALPADRAALAALPTFRGRGARRHFDVWSAAIAEGLALPDRDLPPTSLPGNGPPPPRVWADRDPAAAARLAAARAHLARVSSEHDIPIENLVTPDLVRRLAWSPPASLDEDAVRTALSASGARPWQVDLLAEGLTVALATSAPRVGAEVTGE